MRILIAAECSGKVRDAMRARGHDAMSCDLLPTRRPGPHYQGDVRDVLHEAWDMVIAFPPCTFVCGSSIHWVKRGRVEADGRPRAEHMAEGVAFARMFIDGPETAHIPKRVVENPVGVLSSQVRKPDQIVHPYMFGDDASKSTCLWLHGVEPLTIDPALFVPPRLVVWDGKWVMRWANQTDSGQNNLPPSEDRGDLRSETYDGVAEAMGRCWGERLSRVEDLL
jgi:hypothetical protein